jgi:Zn-dependent peptidase ImmA (M78 family)/transcriptional regulator with XRE-family HTH domain
MANANPASAPAPTIQPDKIVLARESRALTQSALAKRLGCSQAFLSQIEAGVRAAPDTAPDQLSHALDYPSAFFFLTDPVYGSGPNELYHRKRQSTPVRLLRQVYAQVNIQRMGITRLLRSVEVTTNIPRLSVDEFNSPEAIARVLRATWHVPDGPINDLTALIEANGGIVVHRQFASSLLDGMSHWVPGAPPLFFMNASAPRSRRRHTLAHELGHMVLHSIPTPTMEEEANQFAAEFLMPEREARPYLADLSLPRLAELKLYWKVSMAAVLQRASMTGTISRDDATVLWRRLSKAGYRKMEPYELELPAEEPTLLRHIVEMHRTTLAYGYEQLMELLVLHESDFREVYAPTEARLRVVPRRA